MTRSHRVAGWIYDRLLSLHGASLRMQYSEEMRLLFGDNSGMLARLEGALSPASGDQSHMTPSH